MLYQNLINTEPSSVDPIDPGIFLQAFHAWANVADWSSDCSPGVRGRSSDRPVFAPDDLHLVAATAARIAALQNTLRDRTIAIEADWLDEARGYVHPALVKAAALLDVDATLHFDLADLLARARSIHAHAHARTAYDLSLSWCLEHACPRILIGDQFHCVIEYARRLLGRTWVRDIIPDGNGQPLQLCFSNGRALPVLCPHCEESHPVDDLQAVLALLSDLYLVDLKYFLPGDPDALHNGTNGALALAFAETRKPAMFRTVIFVHPNSLRGLE